MKQLRNWICSFKRHEVRLHFGNYDELRPKSSAKQSLTAVADLTWYDCFLAVLVTTIMGRRSQNVGGFLTRSGQPGVEATLSKRWMRECWPSSNRTKTNFQPKICSSCHILAYRACLRHQHTNLTLLSSATFTTTPQDKDPIGASPPVVILLCNLTMGQVTPFMLDFRTQPKSLDQPFRHVG